MMNNKYLELLGVSPGASKQEIKSAFRKLSKIYHPDISDDEEAKEKFIEIHEAYKFLTDVGPNPNNETISYSYDPQLDQYEQWRNTAKAYARKKAREEIRLQNELIQKILKGFHAIGTLIISFNLLLVIDYALPKNIYEQEILGLQKVIERLRGSVNYRYDEVYFEDYTMRFDQMLFDLEKGYDKATVHATQLLSVPIQADITQNGVTRSFRQIYSIYSVFGYIIPAIFIAALLYLFVLKTLDHRLTLAITLVILFIIQITVFSIF